MKKKVLVCGSTGFIGRNIAAALSKKDDIEVYGTYQRSKPLTDPGIRMLRADLTEREDVDKVIKGMDIIIQAAATTSGAKDIVTGPYYHVTANAVMNSLIFRSAHEHNVSVESLKFTVSNDGTINIQQMTEEEMTEMEANRILGIKIDKVRKLKGLD